MSNTPLLCCGVDLFRLKILIESNSLDGGFDDVTQIEEYIDELVVQVAKSQGLGLTKYIEEILCLKCDLSPRQIGRIRNRSGISGEGVDKILEALDFSNDALKTSKINNNLASDFDIVKFINNIQDLEKCSIST